MTFAAIDVLTWTVLVALLAVALADASLQIDILDILDDCSDSRVGAAMLLLPSGPRRVVPDPERACPRENARRPDARL